MFAGVAAETATATIVGAANGWLAMLDAHQQQAVISAFADEQRARWLNLPAGVAGNNIISHRWIGLQNGRREFAPVWMGSRASQPVEDSGL